MPEQLKLPFQLPFNLKKKSIQYCRWIEVVDVEGQTFELGELWNVLNGIKVGDIQITDKRMCEHLKKIKVVLYCGSWRSGCVAEEGERFDAFFKAVSRLVDEEKDGAR